MSSPTRLALLVTLSLVVSLAADYHQALRMRQPSVTKTIKGFRPPSRAPGTKRIGGSMATRTWATTTAAPNPTFFNGTIVNRSTPDPWTLLNGTSLNETTLAPSESLNGSTVATIKGLVRTRIWPTEPATETTFFKPRLVTLPPHPTVVVYTIMPEAFYEFDNSNVEDVIVIWLCFLIVICLLGCVAIFGMRQYFKKITAEKLNDIKRELESQRQLGQMCCAEANNHKPIEPLSDPVTDQAIYYPLGELLKEDAYGGVL